MALDAEAVGILIEKGRFEPEVALGIAEAIEVSMTHAQFVTVAILDARLQELKADMRVALMSLESKFDSRFGEVDRRFGEVDRRFSEVDRKFGEVDRKFAELGGKIDQKFAELLVQLERTKAELVRWVFLVLLGNVALGAGAAAIVEAVKHF